jgi:V8-like Glu-specific endopeptidase
MLRGVVGLALAVLSCDGAVDEVETSRQAIVNGVNDPGDPATVALLSSGSAFCSGTLIAPHTILTAGHCIGGTISGRSVDFGPDIGHAVKQIPYADQKKHPRFTAEGAPYDFGLVRLQDAVFDVSPVSLNRAPLAQSLVGHDTRHVGFGRNNENATGATGLGTKRQATYPITQITDMLVYSGGAAQTCSGDSGGPGFFTDPVTHQEVEISVVSDGPNCHDIGWDMRVDVGADWIDATLAQWDPDAGHRTDAGPAPDGGGDAGHASADAGSTDTDAGAKDGGEDGGEDGGDAGDASERSDDAGSLTDGGGGPGRTTGGCSTAPGPAALLVSLCGARRTWRRRGFTYLLRAEPSVRRHKSITSRLESPRSARDDEARSH